MVALQAIACYVILLPSFDTSQRQHTSIQNALMCLSGPRCCCGLLHHVVRTSQRSFWPQVLLWSAASSRSHITEISRQHHAKLDERVDGCPDEKTPYKWTWAWPGGYTDDGGGIPQEASRAQGSASH
eukprot:366509-Chlamydomonas_euryale.AAC.3